MMGMSQYGSSGNRDGWRYIYKGSELLPYAKGRFSDFFQLEQDGRKKIAALMENPKISMEGREVAEAKNDVEHYVKEREACAVYVHEFSRQPDREYHLASSDVVYFEIVTL